MLGQRRTSFGWIVIGAILIAQFCAIVWLYSTLHRSDSKLLCSYQHVFKSGDASALGELEPALDNTLAVRSLNKMKTFVDGFSNLL